MFKSNPKNVVIDLKEELSVSVMIRNSGEENVEASIIAYLGGVAGTANKTNYETERVEAFRTEMTEYLGYESITCSTVEMACSSLGPEKHAANKSGIQKTKGGQTANSSNEGQLMTNDNSHAALDFKFTKELNRLAKLVQEVREERKGHPKNPESDALLRSSIKAIGQNTRLARKILVLTPKCPELTSEKSIKKLKTFCASQKAILYQNYVDLGGEVDKKQCQAIAKELQVSEERIRKWFSNKKQRDKRRTKKQDDLQ